MTGAENILAQLTRLLDHGTIPRSLCSGALLRTLQPLLDTAVVVEERSGAGRRLLVRDPSALGDFIRKHFPESPVPEGLPSRVAGIARFRDSKTFVSDTPEIVSVRTWSNAALLKDGQPVGAASATGLHGVFSFVLHKRYTLHEKSALVENPALFTHFEHLHLPIDLVIYGHGRASARLLDWLASPEAPALSLLHLPDYDPAGLTEFERLRSRLPGRIRLHLPPDLAERFARFANPALLAKVNTRAMLANLRLSNSPEVRQVVALIDRHNAGLEQEALLLA